MDFKVIFRDTFLDDLEQVVRSIAVHNPVAARKLGELIIAAGESLSFFPERHPLG
jgi:plasmid stabilization system protein ParE